MPLFEHIEGNRFKLKEDETPRVRPHWIPELTKMDEDKALRFIKLRLIPIIIDNNHETGTIKNIPIFIKKLRKESEQKWGDPKWGINNVYDNVIYSSKNQNVELRFFIYKSETGAIKVNHYWTDGSKGKSGDAVVREKFRLPLTTINEAKARDRITGKMIEMSIDPKEEGKALQRIKDFWVPQLVRAFNDDIVPKHEEFKPITVQMVRKKLRKTRHDRNGTKELPYSDVIHYTSRIGSYEPFVFQIHKNVGMSLYKPGTLMAGYYYPYGITLFEKPV